MSQRSVPPGGILATVPANSTEADGIRAEIAALQAQVASARALLTVTPTPTTVSRQALLAARRVVTLGEAAILLLQRELAPQAPRVVVVREGDTLFGLAQDYLGDAVAYGDIQRANGLTFIALSVGQRLILPR